MAIKKKSVNDALTVSEQIRQIGEHHHAGVQPQSGKYTKMVEAFDTAHQQIVDVRTATGTDSLSNTNIGDVEDDTVNAARNFDKVMSSMAAGNKYDTRKPDMSLLSPIALVLLTKVLDFGAKKYAKHNWRKGISEDKLVAACFRHLTAILGGEVCDRETGLPHAAHLMCEAMFLCEQYTSQAGAPVSYQYSEAQLDLLADLLAGKPYEI